jgi:hypothetical protein
MTIRQQTQLRSPLLVAAQRGRRPAPLSFLVDGTACTDDNLTARFPRCAAKRSATATRHRGALPFFNAAAAAGSALPSSCCCWLSLLDGALNERTSYKPIPSPGIAGSRRRNGARQ